MTSDWDRLRELIIKLAVVRGRVVLSSGQEADWYIDLRRITLQHEAAPLVGRIMLDLTDAWSYDAVGGLTLGADPLAAAMLHACAADSTRAARRLDAFVVRKQGKAHGLQRRIEGPDVIARKVLAVEDTATTGGSVLTAVEALRDAGADVVGVAVVVDRGTVDEPSSAERAVRDAGLDYRAAYRINDLGLG
jgi:orotate phosphoribosyltransferase